MKEFFTWPFTMVSEWPLWGEDLLKSIPTESQAPGIKRHFLEDLGMIISY